MQNKSVHLFSAYVFLLTLTLSACKTRKATFHSSYEGMDETLAQRILNVKERAYPDSYSVKAHINIEMQGKEYACKAVLNLVQGKGINLSIRPMWGIELARIVVTPDSLLIIDRINKHFAINSTKEFNFNSYNFYSFIESLLLNRIYVGEDTIQANKFSSTLLPNKSLLLTHTFENEEGKYQCLIDKKNHLEGVCIYSFQKGISVIWEYSNFIKKKNYTLSNCSGINLYFNEKKCYILSHLSQWNFKKEIVIKTTPPKRYTRVDWKELFKTFLI